MTSGLEVVALRYATLSSSKRHLFHRYDTYGDEDAPFDMDYYLWVVRGRDRTIVVDTGFAPEVGVRRGRSCHQAPLELLRRAGIEPDDVDTVVLTHLHYDHSGNVAGFGSARLLVPRRELEFWTSALSRRGEFAAHVERDELDLLERRWREGSLVPVDDGHVVAEGVVLVDAPGHSPGQQVVVVDPGPGLGRVVLAADAVHFYEELELDRPFAIFADLAGMYRGYDIVRDLAASPGARIVPGHDPLVATRFPVAYEDDGATVVRVA